jgi:hypothetical protein
MSSVDQDIVLVTTIAGQALSRSFHDESRIQDQYLCIVDSRKHFLPNEDIKQSLCCPALSIFMVLT